MFVVWLRSAWDGEGDRDHRSGCCGNNETFHPLLSKLLGNAIETQPTFSNICRKVDESFPSVCVSSLLCDLPLVCFTVHPKRKQTYLK